MASALFGHYRAFRWDSSKKALEGVEYPDPIRLEDLVGYATNSVSPSWKIVRGFRVGVSRLPTMC